jgi:hypothetical protein
LTPTHSSTRTARPSSTVQSATGNCTCA